MYDVVYKWDYYGLFLLTVQCIWHVSAVAEMEEGELVAL